MRQKVQIYSALLKLAQDNNKKGTHLFYILDDADIGFWSSQFGLDGTQSDKLRI